MADVDDKEKAEKLAAAKKRFEQLKKQKNKKGGAKKKEDKSEEPVNVEQDPAPEDTPETQSDLADSITFPEDETKPKDDETPEDHTTNDFDRPLPARQPSLSIQSKQRSESFRSGSMAGTSPGLKSPISLPVDSESEVQEIYKKQAARIEELESENKSLAESAARLQRAEEELEELRESSGDVAELKSKAVQADERAKEVERLTAELTSIQRQLSQAQSATKKDRRVSAASPAGDLTEQLASKTSTIESLELELSNLRNQLSIIESTKSTQEATITSLEQRATAAETAATVAQKEIDDLTSSLSAPMTDSTQAQDSDPTELNRKISRLESDLRTAQSSADSSLTRANSLEQKIEAMTKLHRESSTTTASRDKEIKDLKSRIKSLTRSREDPSTEELSDLEDEEREKLHSRIRDLEAENFELRRGVWRDKRATLQPTMAGTNSGGVSEGDTSAAYEDVDLNGTPYTPRGGMTRASSTFQDVLQSGISAFTGRDRRETNEHQGQPYAGTRKQSLGMLSEEGFDENAFARAHEEEAKKRLERVREVKRGLENWRGWRVDLVDLRGGGLGGGAVTGPIFEV